MTRVVRIVSIAVLSLAGLVVAGSPATSAAQQVEIEVGWLSAPEDSIPWLLREIAAFENHHPHIRVSTKNLQYPARRRFQTHADFFGSDMEAVLGANVTGIDGQFNYLAPYLAERGMLKPIEEFDTPDDGFAFADFPAALLKDVRFQGQTWAVPWLTTDTLLVLDWELFDNAGIEEPPGTWEEFLSFAAMLTKDTNGDGSIDQWGIAYRTSDNGLADMLMSLVIQLDDSIMEEGRFAGGDDAIRAAVDFMNKLGGAWEVAKEDPRSLTERLQDRSVRYAMHLEVNHNLGTAIHNPGLRLAMLPSVDDRHRTYGLHRRYFAIRNSTEAKERASWEFIKWMTRPDVSMPDVLAGFPVRVDFTSRADFRARVDGGMQNAHLIFDACRYSTAELDRTVDLALAAERFWQVLVPAFTDPSRTPVYLERARTAGNRFLGDWYPYQ